MNSLLVSRLPHSDPDLADCDYMPAAVVERIREYTCPLCGCGFIAHCTITRYRRECILVYCVGCFRDIDVFALEDVP